MQQRVNFFIAGVQKGGTTALDAMLRQHPNIEMAKLKEVHFFDNDALDWSASDFVHLHSQFDWARQGVIRGEATPIYTYWPGALMRLKRYNSEARLIVGLRHPTFRAYSHWRMEVTRKAETMGFSEAIRIGRERILGSSSAVHRVYSYVERGFYDNQIRLLKALFPAEQLHFFRTDAMWARPDVELMRIEQFLGVEPRLLPSREYIVPLQSGATTAISAEDVRYLNETFQETIASLGRLTGLSFDDWESPDYVEPMRPDS